MNKMYKYLVSGFYFEGEERKHFESMIEACDEIIAMKIVLGEIMWKSSKYFNNKPVKLDCMHCEPWD